MDAAALCTQDVNARRRGCIRPAYATHATHAAEAVSAIQVFVIVIANVILVSEA